MKYEEAREGLRYLISDDCTDSQFDYIDEIETAIKSLQAWDEVLEFINKQLINRPFRNYESTLESRAYEHVKAFIEQKLKEVEE